MSVSDEPGNKRRKPSKAPFGEIPPPEVLIILHRRLRNWLQSRLCSALFALSPLQVLPTDHFWPLHPLLLKVHFLIEEIFVAEESVDDCLHIPHPPKGNSHLEVLILESFLLLFQFLELFLYLSKRILFFRIFLL